MTMRTCIYCLKGLGSITRGKVTKVIKRGTTLNVIIQITLLVSLVIIVEKKDISKLNVQTLTKKKRIVLIGKRRRSPRKDVPT